MRQRQLRAWRLDDVQVADLGRVVFHSSAFGNLDSYRTVFDKGSFAKTLNDHDGKFPVVWFHDPTEPIALGIHSEDDTGLRVEADLDLDVETGRRVYSGLRKGYIDSASIAFSVVTEAIEDDIVHFKEVELFESSLLTRNFASNPAALVDEVRSRTGVEYPKPPPMVFGEADLRDMVTALAGLQDRELTEAERALVAECSTALSAILEPTEIRGEEPPTDIPTEPPLPIVLPAALYEARDLAAALSSRGPIRSPLGMSRTPSIAPELHALLTDIKALGHSLRESERK